MSARDREVLGQAALDWVLKYFDTASESPVYPAVGAAELGTIVDEALPQDPQPVTEVLEQFARLASLGRNNGHPRMFGYVQSSASFAGVAADFLTSALNQNVTSWRSAPSATAVEHQVLDWMKAMSGFDPGAGGILLSGGSLANFAALAVALRASTAADLNQHGVGALPGKPRIYASAMAHMSIPKAAAMLGIGRDAVQAVPVDAGFRMDVDALRKHVASDRAAGRHPVCVVGTAGDVNTGAVDPLGAIADVCAESGVWFHIDGSYGGFAARAPRAAALLSAIGRADSLSLDPHKWLYAPLDAGCLLVRDPRHLKRTFMQGAAYVDVIADHEMSDFAFWDHGPELSRRFRALKIWFILKCHGARAITAAIDDNIAVAQELGAAIDASQDFERLAPSPLSIACFRCAPATLRGNRAGLNALNRAVMVDVQRDGEAYLSNAMVGADFALRACVVNYRTTATDTGVLLDTIRRVAARTRQPL